MKTIGPTALNELREKNTSLVLLDVRTPAEHARVHVPGVHLLPLDRLDATTLAGIPGCAKESPIYILCHSGGRAKQAAEKLTLAEYQDCIVVEGGTLAWAANGLPVVRGTGKVIALERQRSATFTPCKYSVHLAIGLCGRWINLRRSNGLVRAGNTDFENAMERTRW
jgi:rhodanese-related sulfurtransferase